MSTLKERMEELRSANIAVSNAQLAREAGVKPPSVHGWFSGETKSLTWQSVDAIARLYGVEPRWVALGEGPKLPASPWPFSVELHRVVSRLEKSDLWYAENALRAHLKMPSLKELGDSSGGGDTPASNGTHGP
jgi:transcriptional regulator with XRE-family HTH domain